MQPAKDMRLRAVVTDRKGARSLRLEGEPEGVIPLTETDVRLLELAFHTHCPGCEEH